MQVSRNALGNLLNRYRAVLKKCRLANTFGSLAVAAMLVMGINTDAIGTPVEFDRNTHEYTSEVTPPSGAKETQLSGNNTYTFHEGGSIGRIWSPYDSSNIFFNIDKEKTLTIGNNYSDGLEISNGTFTIKGGNLIARTDSPYEEDSAINIRDNGSFTAEVDNFTAINGQESSLKIMSAASDDISASIKVKDDFTLISGGTGLAMEAFSDASVAADITAKNIKIVSSSDMKLPRLGGIYLMSYHDKSKTLDLNMTATESMIVQGAQYGLAGWGDLEVNLTAKDISLISSRDETAKGKGIYLDTSDKTPAAGRDVTITATNKLTVDGYYGARLFGDAILKLSAEEIGISAAYCGFNMNDKATSVVTAGKAIRVDGERAFNMSDNSTLSITSHTIQAEGSGYTATLYDAARLNLYADTVIFNSLGTTTGYAAYIAGEGAEMNIQGKNGGHTKFFANGFMKADKGGKINILMGDGSVYSGYTAVAEGGKLSLNFDGSSLWNVVKSSSLSNITLGGNAGSHIDLRADGNHVGTVVTVDNLSGTNGRFLVNTDIVADASDQIVIGHGEGAHGVYVAPSGRGATREYMETFIVQQQEGSGTFSLSNAGGKVEQGLYFYELAERTPETGGREWYLRRATDTGGTGEKTPTGETVLGLSGMASSYAMYMGQLSDLRERLGEIRHGTGTDGLWVRGFTQENKLSGLGGIDFSQNFYGTSFGYDRLVEQNENNKWLFGVRGQITKADQRIDGLHDGSGDSRSYGVAAYATWQHGDGWYADTVLSWDWYDQDLKTRMLDGTRVHGSYNTYGGGISQEFGRLFRFDDGFFVEPQVQLSWYWVKGTDFTTSNGMSVDQDDMYALTGRAGLVLGKKWDIDEDRFFQPYLKAGVNHEFLGDQKVLVNGIEFSDDLRGTRGYYGAGFDLQFAPNARLYAEFEREDGQKASTPWSVSAGLRVEF